GGARDRPWRPPCARCRPPGRRRFGRRARGPGTTPAPKPGRPASPAPHDRVNFTLDGRPNRHRFLVHLSFGTKEVHVRSFVACRVALLAGAIPFAAARPAAADITVITRYSFINGDTLTRASYYAPKRVRVTAPDGKEFMFNRDNDSVTVINHAAKTYWTGPRALAD